MGPRQVVFIYSDPRSPRLIRPLLACVLVAWVLVPAAVYGYPTDGYEDTHIRRLEADRLKAPALAPGARLSINAIAIQPDLTVTDLPAVDAGLSAKLRAALGDQAAQYGVAVLDLSDPQNPAYAAHNDTLLANVGSVGKLLVLHALFDKLAQLYPDDVSARQRILRDTLISADGWAVYDEHTVPIFDPGAKRIVSRQLRIGDTGNLWEYLDWMLSASNNGAASMVQQQLILLEQFGDRYPVSPPEAMAFLNGAPPSALGSLLTAQMTRSGARQGLDPARIRQGSLFTSSGKRAAPGTSSYATPRELMRLLLAIESGTFVDAWSSLEAKRLLYMTQRRIRYASHPVLADSAVYFKSGSLYRCQAEEGFACKKYMGNVENRLASVVIVETPADEPQLRYLVVVMSNVLRVNSAVAHQTLALRVHRLVEAANAARLKQQGIALAAKLLPAATVQDAEGRDR